MSERNSDNFSMSEALKAFISANQLQPGMDRVQVRDAWKHVMGEPVFRYTERVVFHNGTLQVFLTSSVLREELSHGRSSIIKMLNEALGRPLVRDLKLR